MVYVEFILLSCVYAETGEKNWGDIMWNPMISHVDRRFSQTSPVLPTLHKCAWPHWWWPIDWAEHLWKAGMRLLGWDSKSILCKRYYDIVTCITIRNDNNEYNSCNRILSCVWETLLYDFACSISNWLFVGNIWILVAPKRSLQSDRCCSQCGGSMQEPNQNWDLQTTAISTNSTLW